MLKRITKGNFKPTIRNNKVAVIDFYAEWCGPCKAFNPILQKVAKDYSGKAVVGKINIDKSQTLANKFDVKSIPTVLFFKNGKLVGKSNGAQTYRDLSKNIDGLLGDAAPKADQAKEGGSFFSKLFDRFSS